MEIIFVRHAEKEKIGEDPELTDNGIKQAKFLAKRLKKIKFKEFYTSDMKRAKQTSVIVSKKIGIKPKIVPALNEFKSETMKTSKNKWNKEEKNHYKELISFLEKITKNPSEDKSILIIAHGLTNRIIVSYFLELPMEKTIRFRQVETNINSIYWAKKFKNWRMKKWNDGNHIPDRFKSKNYLVLF